MPTSLIRYPPLFHVLRNFNHVTRAIVPSAISKSKRVRPRMQVTAAHGGGRGGRLQRHGVECCCRGIRGTTARATRATMAGRARGLLAPAAAARGARVVGGKPRAHVRRVAAVAARHAEQRLAAHRQLAQRTLNRKVAASATENAVTRLQPPQPQQQ